MKVGCVNHWNPVPSTRRKTLLVRGADLRPTTTTYPTPPTPKGEPLQLLDPSGPPRPGPRPFPLGLSGWAGTSGPAKWEVAEEDEGVHRVKAGLSSVVPWDEESPRGLQESGGK